MKLERYRPTMTEDVVYSWAGDAQKKIDELSSKLKVMRDSLDDSWSASPEGRVELDDIDRILNS